MARRGAEGRAQLGGQGGGFARVLAGHVEAGEVEGGAGGPEIVAELGETLAGGAPGRLGVGSGVPFEP